ncbi:RNA polymerase sigma factor [Streptomyces sp. NBC_01381]|uniref:RNA polymerase sigma factor n=1 Tax=Streptomyces sp. NBC_01381 TaxID=2903845 RepID=UPI00224EB0D9|nr:RNA polymerase sigma factor [Streptomyces sp. NBC_01381]MCX4672503.1 RNA polymerase sigma factor [Streptomyces sp. NBC_01381]
MTGHPRAEHDPAFLHFFRRHLRIGIAVGIRLGLRRADAEEATNDALATVHDGWQTIDRPEAMFHTVLRRRAIERLRQENRRLGKDNPHRTVEDDGDQGVLPPHDFEDSFALIETKQQLYEVLAGLPHSQRVSLYLGSWGYGPEERAAIKDIPVNTEKSHYRRATARARTIIAAHYPDLIREPRAPRTTHKEAGE